MENHERINCFKCKHFYLTWIPKTPNACRVYGFKSQQMPSVIVLKSSGFACVSFEEKEKTPPK